MSKLYFKVPGEPTVKARPRVTWRRTYTPKKTKVGEQTIAQYFNIKYPHHKVDGIHQFEVTVNFYTRFHSKDIDNLIKAFLDGLNDLVWMDDRQVYKITANKTYVVDGANTEAWIDTIGL